MSQYAKARKGSTRFRHLFKWCAMGQPLRMGNESLDQWEENRRNYPWGGIVAVWTWIVIIVLALNQ